MCVNTARWKVALGRSAILLVITATVACAAGAPTRYRNLTEDWQASGSATPEPATDAETLFEGADALERRELVRLVLARNPTVRAARYAWRAALARYPQVTALDDPMVGAGLAPRSVGSDRVDDAPRFDVSQRLPFPGKLRLRGEAALGEAEAAARDYDAVRLRLATMASQLFDDYALAARSLEINAEHIELLQEFKAIATVRYEAGETSQYAPIQAEVELTHALHREIGLETARRISAEQINALLHRPPNAELPPAQSRVVTPGLAHPVEELIELALAERPDLAAATARVGAEQARLDLARREYFPDFTLLGSYNGVHQESDLKPFVGVQLNVPLRLGRRKAAVEEAEARLVQARSRRLAIEDQVRLGVQSGADRLDEAGHVARLFRDRLLPAARDQVNAARSGFETGANSFLGLIDAERNLRNVELGYEEVLADLARRRAELDRARGVIPGLTW